MYAVFRTQRFEKELAKQLSPEEQKHVENFEKKQLKENPYVGDPLRYPFFREKKVGGKRVYFLIYSKLQRYLNILPAICYLANLAKVQKLSRFAITMT